MKPSTTSKKPASAGKHAPIQRQWGGTILGFIVGVVVGLAAALLVAVYVTKVPVPFMGAKTQGRTAEHDAAESKKNQNWDPNAPLQGRSPARPAAPASAPEPQAQPAPSPAAPGVAAVPAPRPSADPLGDLARSRAAPPAAAPAPAPVTAPATAGATDPFEYFVQAGAFRTPEDAETQRARLAMLGMEARVTEREQAGRTVFRVRMGPFKTKEDAERMKARLDNTGADSALVRVQR